jgi:hypothetical protein
MILPLEAVEKFSSFPRIRGFIVQVKHVPKKYWKKHNSAWFTNNSAPFNGHCGGGCPRINAGMYWETTVWIPAEYFEETENEMGEVSP